MCPGEHSQWWDKVPWCPQTSQSTCGWMLGQGGRGWAGEQGSAELGPTSHHFLLQGPVERRRPQPHTGKPSRSKLLFRLLWQKPETVRENLWDSSRANPGKGMKALRKRLLCRSECPSKCWGWGQPGQGGHGSKGKPKVESGRESKRQKRNLK